MELNEENAENDINEDGSEASDNDIEMDESIKSKSSAHEESEELTCSESSYNDDDDPDHDLMRIVGDENDYKEEDECCSSVIWKIKDFSKYLSAKKRDYIRCPLQDPDRHSELYFAMRLYPKGYSAVHKDCLSLCLSFSFYTDENKIIEYELSILDKHKKELNKLKKFLFHKPKVMYIDVHYPQFAKRKWIIDMKDEILPDDCLTIQIKYNWGIESNSYKNYCHCVNFQSSLFSHDLKLLFDNHNFSDVKLVADEETFYAHKIILAARSPVFSSMFMHSCMQENKDNIVHIQDFSSDVVRQMLHFMYYGTVNEANEQIFYDLLKIADKYDIQGLRYLCEVEIRNTICKDNAVSILTFSNIYNAKILEDMTVDFICQYYDELKETKSFETAKSTHSKLIEKISAIASNNYIHNECRILYIVKESE